MRHADDSIRWRGLKKKDKKLIDYLLSHNRRLISPVGGGSEEKFNQRVDTSKMTPEKKIAQWLCFQTNEYGHDFVFSSIPYIDICKYLNLKTYIASDNIEHVCPNQINSRDDLKKLMEFKSFDAFMTNPYIQAVKEFKKLSATPVGIGGFGPVTLGSFITGVDVFLKNCIEDPLFIQALSDYFAEFLIRIAHTGESDGADFLWVGEPVTVMISPKHFKQFSGQYVKKIFDSVPIPGFLHIPGNANHLIDEMVQTGAQCLSLDYHIDVKKIAYTVPSDVVTLGNIYTGSMVQDDVKEVEGQVSELIQKIRNFPNFIVSSGGGVISNTPDENINALFNITSGFPVWTTNQYRQINDLWKLMAAPDWEAVKDYLSENDISEKILSASKDEALDYLNFQLEIKMISHSDYIERMNDITSNRNQIFKRNMKRSKRT